MRIDRLIRFASRASFAAVLWVTPAIAQSSPSYKLSGSVVNNGGNPTQGVKLTAPSYRLSLDSIGEGVVSGDISSASFRVGSGFVGDYPPPGEVKGLSFSNKTTLQWNPERSVGKYALYRGPISSLPGGFGNCFVADLPGETTNDTAVPTTGQGFFYLATARNRLREEGTKGNSSNGGQRANPSPCP